MIELVPPESARHSEPALPAHLRAGPADAERLFLLFHGFPDSARVWEPLMAALPEDSLRIAPFAPGTDGTPPRSRADFSLVARSEAIARLARALDPPGRRRRRIALIGHDLGGALVEPMRAALAEDVDACVYLNSLTLQQFYKRKTRLPQLLRSLYIVGFQIPFLTRRTLAPVGRALRKRIYDLGGLPAADAMRGESDDVLWGIESYRRYMPDFVRMVGRPVERSAVPTLFLHGTHDPYILPSTRPELERFFDAFELVTLGAGHWPQRDRADEVAGHVLGFLARGARDGELDGRAGPAADAAEHHGARPTGT